jgi:hypothetical protein
MLLLLLVLLLVAVGSRDAVLLLVAVHLLLLVAALAVVAVLLLHRRRKPPLLLLLLLPLRAPLPVLLLLLCLLRLLPPRRPSPFVEFSVIITTMIAIVESIQDIVLTPATSLIVSQHMPTAKGDCLDVVVFFFIILRRGRARRRHRLEHGELFELFHLFRIEAFRFHACGGDSGESLLLILDRHCHRELELLRLACRLHLRQRRTAQRVGG